MQWKHFSNSSHGAVYIQSFWYSSESDNKPEMSHSVRMNWMCACVWILTTVTGHGCRGHLVDNRTVMGRGPAQHSVSLDRLWNILLCHLPLRACGKNSIRSPILRTQVGLISTKQSEVHFFNEGTSLKLSDDLAASQNDEFLNFLLKGALYCLLLRKLCLDKISKRNILVTQKYICSTISQYQQP